MELKKKESGPRAPARSAYLRVCHGTHSENDAMHTDEHAVGENDRCMRRAMGSWRTMRCSRRTMRGGRCYRGERWDDAMHAEVDAEEIDVMHAENDAVRPT